MNRSLTAIPSDKEIKKTIFAIHPDKASGPDGFFASFFQANWIAVGPAIVAEIREFFITGCMPDTINRTHVRLIPKGQNTLKVEDYRPIALCNVYYKIILKLLSLRLRPVLNEIISENQSAFLPGRAIADNFLITHEILHYLKGSDARKHCYMAVKTDMSKAYDGLEWDFIRQVLEKLGFAPVWINWVMQCISTVSYFFIVNDSALGNVTPSRGIRQGDPCLHTSLSCAGRPYRACAGWDKPAEISPELRSDTNAPESIIFSLPTTRCFSPKQQRRHAPS